MSEILLYGEVGWDFDAEWLNERLEGSEGDVTLRVHSPGGDVFDGVAIANTIRRARSQGRRVTAVVDGLAASAASYMCLTCDEVVASPGTVFMVHPPSGMCWGTAEDMRKTARALDACHDSIASLYRRRTGRSAAEVDAAMRDETWLTDEQAVAWGLADRVDGGEARDLSEVDAKWTSVMASADYAAFAHAHPAMDRALESHREHSERFGKRLLESLRAGNPPVDNAVPTLAPTADGDGPAEAAGTGEGEAPAYAIANGHVYRIGSKE